ncbi:MAG: DUF1501 domain-containing protein [Isosphaeraceae bacterium]
MNDRSLYARHAARREFLKTSLGLSPLLGMSRLLAAEIGGAGLLAPRPTHHAPKAKQLIVVFLTGGFSHVDTFDYKPRLQSDAGKPVPSFGLRADETAHRPLLGSPFRFARRGDSGLWISELFPRLGDIADELCVIRSMHTDIVEHFQAVLAMHTGSATVPLPSMGAWLSHGLGTFNANLPSHVVLCEHLPYAGSQVWDSSFLPPIHQGVRIIPGSDPIPDLRPPPEPVGLRELERAMLEDLNREHARARPDDHELTARIGTFATARGMVREAPEVLDMTAETPSTLDLYGIRDRDPRSYGAQCLIVRRLIERGVRVVELIDTGSSNNWDAHGDMRDHLPKAARVDRALAALITDLKRRGLLSQTLLAICTEFGRTPWTDGPGARGRNHYAKAFSVLLAGAGVKGGHAYGATDDYGINIVENPVHVHDYHATILHLMGIDHTRLTYRYAGRDFRLTDVDGKVINDVLS